MKKIVMIITAMAIYSYSFGQVKVISNGNVGIGTGSITPAQKLHVVGNTYLSGNLGIGVSNPTYKLQVSGGTVRIDGGLFTMPIPVVLSVKGAVHVENGSTTQPAGLDIEYLQGAIIGGGSFTHTELRGVVNNNLGLGNTGNKLRKIWVYDVDYQNLIHSSDMRLKENIKPCLPFLSKLKNIKSYNYNYKDDYFKDFTPEDKQKAQKTEIGFLAQEFQHIFPDLVHENEQTGMLGINYVGLIPILTSAINELQQEKESQQDVIEKLQQKVDALENALNRCCNAAQPKSTQTDETGVHTQEFNLDANVETLKVHQNAPNPFNTTTTIQCYIPQTIQKAELCVYNMQGAQVKCLTISERGTVDVQIQAGQLSAGIYTYLLIGDSQTSDAKQMILTK